MFEPIAIVGRSCLLPKANSPHTLWNNVLEGRDCLMNVPKNYWGVNLEELFSTERKPLQDVTYTQRGGYVEEFDSIFNAGIFSDNATFILQQDVICQWLLHAGKLALQQANYSFSDRLRKKAGAIIGNVSYPTRGMSEYAAAVWLTAAEQKFINEAVDLALIKKKQFPLHRFMSGYPIHFTAKILGLNAASYAIDAACASSLYAIKLACDYLHAGQADLMLAGGINQADDLFSHIGFSALEAISKTGQSRPLHRDADGLIPAQGVALVALKRLGLAIEDKNKIYGVIRAVGLSNNGAKANFLAPSKLGQLQAMKNAYQNAAVNPSDISWIECHATGTPVGDRIEIESILELFGKNQSVYLSTLKSNIGHTVTASGAAALLNVLSAFEHKIKPPSRLNQDVAMDLLRDGNFEIPNCAIPWDYPDGFRYAAINNFGFGGNNAHLIVQDWGNQSASQVIAKTWQHQTKKKFDKIAIVALGIKCSKEKKIEHIELPIQGIRFPPTDLENTLGQQLILIDLLQQLLLDVSIINLQKTSVFIGMQCDTEIARYNLKWRLSRLFPNVDKHWLKQTKEAIAPFLSASRVIGCMPNIVTNRLNHQFDFQGASFSVSAEELSGIRGLQIAINALNHHEIDNAVVGAVDLSCEIAHTEAIRSVLPPDKHEPGDVAVMVVLKRAEDAKQAGDKIYGFLSLPMQQKIDTEIDCDKTSVNKIFGYSHVASGLLNIVSLLTEYQKSIFTKNNREEKVIKIVCKALGDQVDSIILELV